MATSDTNKDTEQLGERNSETTKARNIGWSTKLEIGQELTQA